MLKTNESLVDMPYTPAFGAHENGISKICSWNGPRHEGATGLLSLREADNRTRVVTNVESRGTTTRCSQS